MLRHQAEVVEGVGNGLLGGDGFRIERLDAVGLRLSATSSTGAGMPMPALNCAAAVAVLPSAQRSTSATESRTQSTARGLASANALRAK
jgi:hypothetical protein